MENMLSASYSSRNLPTELPKLTKKMGQAVTLDPFESVAKQMLCDTTA
jgi:hypothetical protein